MTMLVELGMTLDEMMDTGEMGDGVFEVDCPCGECHTLEPDGACDCDCGRRIESPLLALGLI